MQDVRKAVAIRLPRLLNTSSAIFSHNSRPYKLDSTHSCRYLLEGLQAFFHSVLMRYLFNQNVVVGMARLTSAIGSQHALCAMSVTVRCLISREPQ